MPCYDPNYDILINDETSDPPQMTQFQKNKKLQKEINQLTSMLCALMSELKYPNNNHKHKAQCIDNATKACGISLESWYAEHKQQDVNRLKELIANLNDHELELLKQQLNKK